jgi:hypothetical protein
VYIRNLSSWRCRQHISSRCWCISTKLNNATPWRQFWHPVYNNPPTKCTIFHLRYLYYIITLSVPACCSLQWPVIRKNVSNDTAISCVLATWSLIRTSVCHYRSLLHTRVEERCLRSCMLAASLNLTKQPAEKCFAFRGLCHGKILRDRKRSSPFALLNMDLS